MGFAEGRFAPGQRSPEAIGAWLGFHARVPGNDGFARIQRAFDDAPLRPVMQDYISRNTHSVYTTNTLNHKQN